LADTDTGVVNELFQQIAQAAENGLYFLALARALIVTDICGALEVPGGQASGRVMFIEPGAASPVQAHMNVLMDALNIDVRLFCLELVQAAMTWQATVTGTEPSETNAQKFVTRYGMGLRHTSLACPSSVSPGRTG